MFYPRDHLHLVLDNSSTHETPEVVQRFSLLNARAIRSGVFKSVRALRYAIQRFLDAWNENCQPFKWVKTAPEILAKAKPKGFQGPGH